uniref:Putative c-3 sterol dehydrogenase/3-beta-hydroxysteroid dehydrogenase n=1 Tax=Culex tarsalis TaxID=7177 RepID=A0A1Q3F9G2_CULTA
MSKPKVLILGGCGFIGRHLVDYLVTNDLASKVKVVDKTPPQMAWLNRRHTAAFASPVVEFCSGNLINVASCQNAFKIDSEDGSSWDFVINCAAETKPGQTDPVYQEGILKLAMNCANEAAKCRCKRFVELSTGSMCSSEKVPQKEDCPVEPWTMVGKYKAQTEQELAKVNGLSYTILRLPICYGTGDRKGLTPRIIIAGIYKYLNETMKLLWTGSMKMNVVHVDDVSGALWELVNNEQAAGQIFNICDDSGATQETITDLLAEIFNIKTDYWGIVMSSMTKTDMAGAIEEVNDKHLGPWAELCQLDGVLNTPLTPYMDQELLLHKHLNLDNGKLKSYGYQLRRPKITRESLEEIARDFVESHYFPKSLLLES